NAAIVCLLIYDKPFCASLDNRDIVLRSHRAYLNRNGRKIRSEGTHAFSKVFAARKLWMLASDEKDLTKSLASEMLRFGNDFVHIERDAKDWIIARETAIPTIVDAFVGKIQRSEQTHCPSKILQSKGARSLRRCFELLIRFLRAQLLEALNQLRFPQRQIVQS